MAMVHQFKIGEVNVGGDADVYVVAEIGSNFDQSLDLAKKLIQQAAASGADAVKFQVFDPDALYPKGHELNDLFRSIRLNPDWIPQLMTAAKQEGVEFLASAFDPGSIEVLNSAGVGAHKVASSETTKLEHVAQMAQSGKPLLVATGMCDLTDVAEAVQLCRSLGNPNIALLQCTSEYPLKADNANLRAMGLMADAFDVVVGFSDHTESVCSGAVAVALGARILEKHVTHSRSAKGPDHSYALEMDAFAQYVSFARESEQLLGSRSKFMTPSEQKFGRRNGLYAAAGIKGGQPLLNQVAVRRPAIGIPARFSDVVAKAKAVKDVPLDAPLEWTDIKW